MTSFEFDPDAFLRASGEETERFTEEFEKSRADSRKFGEQMLLLISQRTDAIALDETMREAVGSALHFSPLVIELEDLYEFSTDPYFKNPSGDDEIDDRLAHQKTIAALHLINVYGEEPSLEIRKLLDELAPIGPSAVQLSSIDLELGSSGETIRKDDERMHYIVKMRRHAQQILPDVLDNIFGIRDDSDRMAAGIARIGMFRALGQRKVYWEEYVDELRRSYPDNLKQIDNLIIAFGKKTVEDLPDHIPIDAEPPENWTSVFYMDDETAE